MRNWDKAVIDYRNLRQGVACYRLDGEEYLNEYYIVSEAERESF